jgi:hypothetical protein
MSASRWIEVQVEQPFLKAEAGGPATEPGGPVAFRLYGDLPGLPSEARGEAFVGKLAQAEPALAERLGRLMPELLRHEEALFEWMSHGDHAKRFVEDPVGAFAEAVPGSAELVAELRTVAQDLSASSQGGAR